MRFSQEIEKALFLSRPNRFVVRCDVKGRAVRAHLPNPGRMWELLLPGCTLYLERAAGKGRKHPYTAVAVEREGIPILLHTTRNNQVARYLLEQGRVPGLEGAEIAAAEVTVGKSRFDFLLEKDGREILLEVKSCTLFGGRVAMFPDAVTARGKKHVEHLASLAGKKRGGAVLFLAHWPRAEIFLPDYHTDLEFWWCYAWRAHAAMDRDCGWLERHVGAMA